MQFVALTRRLVDRFTTEQFLAEQDRERLRARTLYAEGAFRALHSRGDVPGAVIVVEARDAAEAETLVASLPYAQLGMMEYDIVPLLPYGGFVP